MQLLKLYFSYLLLFVYVEKIILINNSELLSYDYLKQINFLLNSNANRDKLSE